MVPNPFDLTGGPFLALYGALLMLVLLAGRIPRARRQDGGPIGSVTEADQLAFLAGGPARVVDTIVSRLLAAGALRMIGRRQFRTTLSAYQPSPAERRVLALPQPAAWRDVHRALQPHTASIERQLVSIGAAIDPAGRARARLHRSLPYAALMLFGGIKLVVGLTRDRPVGYLALLLILTGILAAVRWVRADHATAAGAAALDAARQRADRLRRAPIAGETGLAVALFGTAVLAGSEWAGYHQYRTGGSSDGGSGCGAGDSSGGGGCGGGGCGGCGGD